MLVWLIPASLLQTYTRPPRVETCFTAAGVASILTDVRACPIASLSSGGSERGPDLATGIRSARLCRLLAPLLEQWGLRDTTMLQTMHGSSKRGYHLSDDAVRELAQKLGFEVIEPDERQVAMFFVSVEQARAMARQAGIALAPEDREQTEQQSCERHDNDAPVQGERRGQYADAISIRPWIKTGSGSSKKECRPPTECGSTQPGLGPDGHEQLWVTDI